MKTFKSTNQGTLELIQSGDVKAIKEAVQYLLNSDNEISNLTSETLLTLVKENSNDFTKDIATKSLDNKYNLTEKQAWCIAYQIKNNQEVYVIAMTDFIEEDEEMIQSEEMIQAISELKEKYGENFEITFHIETIESNQNDQGFWDYASCYCKLLQSSWTINFEGETFQ